VGASDVGVGGDCFVGGDGVATIDAGVVGGGDGVGEDGGEEGEEKKVFHVWML